MARVYPLEALLKIYRRREESAERAMAKAQQRLISAQRALAKTQESWQQFKEWWPKQEEMAYASILEKTISQQKLNELKEQGKVWREQEMSLEKEVEDAKQSVLEAQESLENCRKVYRDAVIKVRKIEIHREEWSEKVFQEEMEAMEKEAEDRPWIMEAVEIEV